MAPSKAQSKPPRSASGRVKGSSVPASVPTTVVPTTRQHVVPAIPLAYINKPLNRNRNTATKPLPNHASTPSTSSNGLPASSLEAALISRDPLHPTNDTGNEAKNQNAENPATTASPLRGPEQQHQPFPSQMNSAGHIDAASTPAASSVAEETRDANGSPSYVSQAQSMTSATNPEFVPSFPAPSHPLQHQHHMISQHQHVFYAPHPHQMHSNQHGRRISSGGGIMFGGFDSHTPSPVPLPGGFMPPPHPINGENCGHPRPNGHHQAHSNGTGFPAPINTHFRGDIMPISAVDAYGTALAPTPPVHVEAYTPGAGRYGPPTPHSFHGSHTSGELNGMDNAPLPFPPSGSYGPHARREHHPNHHYPAGPFPPFIPLQHISRQFDMGDDDVMDGIRYIRSLFDNTELADCVLELISVKGFYAPVRIEGHKLILARSPALKQRILMARAKDRDFRLVAIESDDPYLRSDAWWMAVQRLYQHPLFQLPPMLNNAGNGVDFAGNKADRFSFCLGYAAAGHVLAMRDVLVRGLEMAASAISWDTIEVGLGFVLENTIARHLDESEEAPSSTILEFGYGHETKILLSAILAFLITEFPSNFELDTSVLDAPKIARIPRAAIIASPTHGHITSKVVPAIARGTTTRQPQKQARLSSIKFGDLPVAYPDAGTPSHREPAKCSPILSRILLNLPFDELRQVLTSGSNEVPGWNTAPDRYHAVFDIVAEREARRLHAVQAVRSEAVPNAHDIQYRLSAHHRYTTAEQWDVLNWKEEVIRDETPRIVRRWVPQFDIVQQPAQQRSPSPYDAPDSMV
ncbi:putative topoisomerase II-associated-like protein [Rosellinia necatrix]|uniref:Putative topoisomerase II-associated-like protein n=1 Tax=Rosellinia necatrix TaxID=77044 RepID=A0A1W2TSC0_ROSNE|nr:putative topoisomerase II-associated-like protein [Rosellinia necatrix]